ncbi:hypothetical protein HK098_005654 [Nowakowskiella sp. JEL0407]|nr:hypothetical protein HK098_005654 [Nowakowskiella sp. JEL0407]
MLKLSTTTLIFSCLSLCVVVNAQSCASVYQQCGGLNFNGLKNCCSGSVCTFGNPYYSQCLPQSNNSPSPVPPSPSPIPQSPSPIPQPSPSPQQQSPIPASPRILLPSPEVQSPSPVVRNVIVSVVSPAVSIVLVTVVESGIARTVTSQIATNVIVTAISEVVVIPPTGVLATGTSTPTVSALPDKPEESSSKSSTPIPIVLGICAALSVVVAFAVLFIRRRRLRLSRQSKDQASLEATVKKFPDMDPSIKKNGGDLTLEMRKPYQQYEMGLKEAHLPVYKVNSINSHARSASNIGRDAQIEIFSSYEDQTQLNTPNLVSPSVKDYQRRRSKSHSEQDRRDMYAYPERAAHSTSPTWGHLSSISKKVYSDEADMPIPPSANIMPLGPQFNRNTSGSSAFATPRRWSDDSERGRWSVIEEESTDHSF